MYSLILCEYYYSFDRIELMCHKYLHHIIITKNVSSSITHKKLSLSLIPKIWEFSFFLSSTIIYQPILIQISMSAKIRKTQKTTLVPKYSSTFVYGPILIQICRNANIRKTHFCHIIIYDLMSLLCYGEVL